MQYQITPFDGAEIRVLLSDIFSVTECFESHRHVQNDDCWHQSSTCSGTFSFEATHRSHSSMLW